MTDLFLKLVNMSAAASWLILAVLVLRFVLRKAPKWVHVLLWGIVAMRLVCPFSIESALSLIPSAEPIRPDIMTEAEPSLETGIPAVNNVLNPIIEQNLTPAAGDSVNPLQIWLPILAALWCSGVILLLLYAAVSYGRLLRRVGTAVLYEDNIYQSEHIASPFILGIIRPRIYIPFFLPEESLPFVLAHEEAHLRRHDHWWKPLGFLLLAVYWFNPLVWLGYILLCRDIEFACDEKVIREFDSNEKADYSQALLDCSVNRRQISACPLAFGESAVKKRVKSVLYYKRPAFWVIAAACAACIAIIICFLTNPYSDKVFDLSDASLALIIAQEGSEPVRLSGAPLETLSADIMQYRYEKKGKVSEYAEWLYQITWYDGDGNEMESLSVLDDRRIVYQDAFYQADAGQLDLTLMAQLCTLPPSDMLSDFSLNNTDSFGLPTGSDPLSGSVPSAGSDPLSGSVPSVGSDPLSGSDANQSTPDSNTELPLILDLNRNGIEETLVQKEIDNGNGYAVEIYENEERIFYDEGGYAHIDWDALFLCVLDGENYLLRYNPALNQGMFVYSYELFTLEDGYKTIASNRISFDVNFGAPHHTRFDPEEIAAFMDEINGYLAHSTQILNTDYTLLAAFERTGRLEDDLGILFDEAAPFTRDNSKSLSENLQLYQETMEADAAQTASYISSLGLPFDSVLEMMFCSGAGGWQTMLNLYPDGSFTGVYRDSEMGSYSDSYPNGIEYICRFHGSFTDIVQLSDASWSLTLNSLYMDTGHEIGEEWISDGTLYIASGPYGFSDADDNMPRENARFILYSPEAQGHASGTELYGATEFQNWQPDRHEYLDAGDTLGCYGLHNLAYGYGFFSLDGWGLE